MQRQRRGDQKATGFDPDQAVGLVVADGVGHLVHGFTPGVGMLQQCGNIVKQNSRLGEIRYFRDMVF